MSAEHVSAADAIRPAACVVVVDDSADRASMLMGRRRPEQIFLPNKWVFPGGRVDRGDGDPLGCQLTRFTAAARRELGEETGYHLPVEAPLVPLARAITPPGQVRRYDTWFFLARRTALLAASGPGDGELLDLAWFTLDDALSLDLPHITRLIINDVAGSFEQSGSRHEPVPATTDIPFYFDDNGVYQRTLLPIAQMPALP